MSYSAISISVFSATSASCRYIKKGFIQKFKYALCLFVVVVIFVLFFFFKENNRYLGSKPSILIGSYFCLLTSTPFHLFTALLIQLNLFLSSLSPTHCSYHIIHFFLSSFCLSSPSLPHPSPLVYWFSRLRIPRVEDCNTQASNYFGVCLFAFPLHLFGLCL